jgi:hypothetical protein
MRSAASPLRTDHCLFFRNMAWTQLLARVLRKEMEQEPIVFLSCVLGTVGASESILPAPALHPRLAPLTPLPTRSGLALPLFFGDGGRAAENDATTYSYRIKYLYPKRSPAAE